MNNLLDDLFFKYKADKTPRIKHHYSDVYFELFKDRRETVKKVLEIGTAEGASLFAWRDFFPNAIIYGLEIDKKRVENLQNLDRIKVFQGNQSYQEDLVDLINQIGTDIDLVIDDGSHKREDQSETCIELMHWLKPGVTYVIEDVADPLILSDFSIYEDVYSWEMLNLSKRYDDRLVILKHK